MTLEVIAFPDSTHTAAEPRAPSARSSARSSSRWSSSSPARTASSSRSCASCRARTGWTSSGWPRSSGGRDVRRATAREADELTGFTIGGIPPFGHARRTRVIMDPDLGPVRDRLGRGGPARPRSSRSRRRSCGCSPTPTSPRSPRSRRSSGRPEAGAEPPRRDDRLPGRPARALALGRLRPGGRGLRPVRGRRRAGRSRAGGRRRSRTRCAGPSCASTGPAGALDGPPRLDDQRRAGRAALGHGGPARREVRLPRATASTRGPGALRWSHRSATPLLAVFASSRLRHVLAAGRARDVRDRGRRDGRLADRPLRRRRPRRRWSAAGSC